MKNQEQAKQEQVKKEKAVIKEMISNKEKLVTSRTIINK